MHTKYWYLLKDVSLSKTVIDKFAIPKKTSENLSLEMISFLFRQTWKL